MNQDQITNEKKEDIHGIIRRAIVVSQIFAAFFILVMAVIFFSLMSCSSSKNTTTKTDTLSIPKKELIPANELKGLDLPEGDSLLVGNAMFTRISPEYYLFTDTEKHITKTEYKNSPRKIKTTINNTFQVNSNNQVNSENKNTTKDKSTIDNSSKVNSDNKKNKDKSNHGSRNRHKEKEMNGGFPWWWLILLIVAVVAWFVSRYFKIKLF